jgi:branched-chain amino acid transport system substrate-binding protein
LKGNVEIVSPTNAFQFIRKAAGAAAENTYATVRYYEKFNTPANKQFVNKFSDAYGRPPDNFAHVVWVHAWMYANAIAQAGTTETDPIIDALEQVSYDGPMGTVTFRECDHQVKRPVQLGEIVAPKDYDWPDVSVTETIDADEAITSCEDTGCSF